jgi:uncharacterized protein
VDGRSGISSHPQLNWCRLFTPSLAPSMDLASVFALLTQHQVTLRKMGVESLAIFGSVARDDARPDSDVDLLVELEAPVTFDRYMDVKFYLEDLLAKPVDLVTALSLKPQLRAIVEREAIRVG